MIPKEHEPVILPKLLYVEGRDDSYFIEELLKYLGLENEIEVRKYDGTNNLKPRLSALLQMSGFSENVKKLGILRDADESFLDSEKSLTSLLKELALDHPAGDKYSLNVKYFIFPNDSSNGTLETLLLDGISEDLNPQIGCVERFFDCLKVNSLDSRVSGEKARIQAFLSCLIEKGESYLLPARACQKGKIFPFNNSCFEPIIKFIKEL